MVAIPKESWSGKIKEIAFGATDDEGGTRDRKLLLGGETTLPFLAFEGKVSRPAIGMEVIDHVGDDYHHIIIDAIGDVIKDPVAWARACVDVHSADFICLKLLSTNPEEANVSAEDAASLVSTVLAQVKAPLIIQGSGDYEKDARVMELCGDAAKGERRCGDRQRPRCRRILKHRREYRQAAQYHAHRVWRAGRPYRE